MYCVGRDVDYTKYCELSREIAPVRLLVNSCLNYTGYVFSPGLSVR